MSFSISAIVVAKNEEKRILNCLNSLSWVNELIVVDNGSIDNTGILANKFGAKVFRVAEEKLSSFSARKNYAFKKAKCDWILFLDADEEITKNLKKEILEEISKQSLTFSAYAMPRENRILGKVLKYGGWWPDFVIRLIKKDTFAGFSGRLHEQPNYQGSLGYLKNFILHNKHDNITDMVEKTNNWSEIEAELMVEGGHPKMNIVRFFTAGWREFYLRIIKYKAFLDGWIGTIYGMYQVYSRLVSYSKLWERQLRQH